MLTCPDCKGLGVKVSLKTDDYVYCTRCGSTGELFEDDPEYTPCEKCQDYGDCVVKYNSYFCIFKPVE